MTESMLNPIKITDGSKEHLKALESSIQKATSKEQLSAISIQDKELLKKNYKVTRLTKEDPLHYGLNRTKYHSTYRYT